MTKLFSPLVIIIIKQNYTVSQKTIHYNIVHNFAKCWPIFKICSPTASMVNMQQNCH